MIFFGALGEVASFTIRQVSLGQSSLEVGLLFFGGDGANSHQHTLDIHWSPGMGVFDFVFTANQQFQVYSSILFQDTLRKERSHTVSSFNGSLSRWFSEGIPRERWDMLRNRSLESWSRHPGKLPPEVKRCTEPRGWKKSGFHQLMLVVYAHYFSGFSTIPGGETPIFSSINSSTQYRYLCRSRSYLYITRGLWVFSNEACVYRCTYVEIDTSITFTSKFCIKSTWVHITRLWRWYALEKGLGS